MSDLEDIALRSPVLGDGMAVFRLVENCPPLDMNSSYCNLLQCSHFADTSVVAQMNGALLGFIAGVTGIGGGVYLVPLIILIGLGTAKEAAACGAFFIWVNSISGLLARFQHNAIDVESYLPLIVGAVIGGLGGSLLGAGRFHPQTMQKILGSILVVAVFLLSNKIIVLIGSTYI